MNSPIHPHPWDFFPPRPNDGARSSVTKAIQDGLGRDGGEPPDFLAGFSVGMFWIYTKSWWFEEAHILVIFFYDVIVFYGKDGDKNGMGIVKDFAKDGEGW